MSAVAGPRPPARPRAVHWSVGFLQRVGHLWVENPLNLGRFFLRLLGAWRCVLFDLSPRQLGRTWSRMRWVGHLDIG